MQDVNRPPLPPAGIGGTGSQHPDLETLNAFLDGELSPRERVDIQTHVASCAACQEELRGLKATKSLLQGLPEFKPRRSFQLTPAMAAEARGAAGNNHTTNANVVPLRREQPSAGAGDEGAADGRGNVVSFLERTRYIAAIAAVLAIIILGTALVSRLNDGDDDSNGSVPQAAVSGTEAASDAEPALDDDNALLGGEVAAPSRSRDREDESVYATAPRGDAPTETDEPTLVVPAPTLVPLPPPPAVLPSDAPNGAPTGDAQPVGAVPDGDRVAIWTSGRIRPDSDSALPPIAPFGLVLIELVSAGVTSDTITSDTDDPGEALLTDEDRPAEVGS